MNHEEKDLDGSCYSSQGLKPSCLPSCLLLLAYCEPLKGKEEREEEEEEAEEEEEEEGGGGRRVGRLKKGEKGGELGSNLRLPLHEKNSCVLVLVLSTRKLHY